MKCPHCSAELPETNHFCEECGHVLAESPSAPRGVCVRCGAPPDAIDDEGFCTSCGVKYETPRVPLERDHLELSLSPAFAGVTDRGLRHQRNEDFLAMQILDSTGARMIIVCDGVSSTRDPDRASKAAGESALRYLNATPATSVEGAFAAAQDAVAALAVKGASDKDCPATTMVLAVVSSDGGGPAHITIGWVGDSRAYWIGPHSAVALTQDHSWLTEALTSGKFSEEEALKSPSAHAITRWLGADAPENAVQVAHFDVQGPGVLLLCTDGLWNYAPGTDDIMALMAANTMGNDTLSSARALVEFANAQGGQDNITVALLAI